MSDTPTPAPLDGWQLVRDAVRDILGVCSRTPHSQDPKAGPYAVQLIREIEALAMKARDGIEAQRGLNDVFPGDEYPDAAAPPPPSLPADTACECGRCGATLQHHCSSCDASLPADVREEVERLLPAFDYTSRESDDATAYVKLGYVRAVHTLLERLSKIRASAAGESSLAEQRTRDELRRQSEAAGEDMEKLREAFPSPQSAVERAAKSDTLAWLRKLNGDLVDLLELAGKREADLTAKANIAYSMFLDAEKEIDALLPEASR